MSDDVKALLRAAPPVTMVSPYFNVADKLYLGIDAGKRILAYIEELERKIAALETYLDGPARRSASGVPITKP